MSVTTLLLVLPEPFLPELLRPGCLYSPAQGLAQPLGDRRPPSPEEAEGGLEQLRLEDVEVQQGLVPGRDDDTLTAVASGPDHSLRQSRCGQKGEQPKARFLQSMQGAVEERLNAMFEMKPRI